MAETHELARMAGGVIVGGFDGTTLPDVVRDRLGRGLLGGVTLFKRNIENIEQVAALCAAIADAAPHDQQPVISVDQEGGRVARLGAPVTPLPPMRVLGAIDDVALTRRVGALLARSLRALGFNLDFAPVADVDSNPANPVIGDRAFGRDPELVSRHVVALIEGLQGNGLMACAKHFPGHGDTETDSHLELPRVRHDRARLDAVELPPFRAAVRANVATVMTAHVVYEGIDPGVPATLSSAIVTRLLRHELGFAGVCYSDDLHMNALSARMTIEDAALRAIEAGCDGLLICTDPASQERARAALEARAGKDWKFAQRLREAFGRMLAARRAWPPQPARGAAALRAALESPEHARVRDELESRAPRG